MTVNLTQINKTPDGAEAILSVDGEKRSYSLQTEMIDLQGQDLQLLKADQQLFSEFSYYASIEEALEASMEFGTQSFSRNVGGGGAAPNKS